MTTSTEGWTDNRAASPCTIGKAPITVLPESPGMSWETPSSYFGAAGKHISKSKTQTRKNMKEHERT